MSHAVGRDSSDAEGQAEECENMKRRKLSLILIGILMLIGTAMTVSAKKLGANYEAFGIELGWVLILTAIIIGLLSYFKVWSTTVSKLMLPIAIIAIIAGLAMSFVDVDTTADTGEVTSSVSWDAEIESTSGSNISYDDDTNKITCLCHVNSTAGTILATNDGTYTNPTINWSIAPSIPTGLTDLDKGATTTVYIVNPDYEYTEDGSEYYLIAETSSGKREVNFTNDGSSSYESKQCTVQFGESEYVELYIDWYDTGVANLDTGESKSITAVVGEETYTITLIVTGVIT